MNVSLLDRRRHQLLRVALVLQLRYLTGQSNLDVLEFVWCRREAAGPLRLDRERDARADLFG